MSDPNEVVADYRRAMDDAWVLFQAIQTAAPHLRPECEKHFQVISENRALLDRCDGIFERARGMGFPV